MADVLLNGLVCVFNAAWATNQNGWLRAAHVAISVTWGFITIYFMLRLPK